MAQAARDPWAHGKVQGVEPVVPTMERIREVYGKEMADRMVKTGWLDGITVKILPDGSHDIPCPDILRAFRAARGQDPGEDWD